MIKTIKIAMLLMIAGILSGCLNNTDAFVSDETAVGADASVNSILLLLSSPQLGSGGTDTVTVTAIVKDSGNLVMADIPVVFTASSGSLEIVQGTTDASGQATANLTPGGDYNNRTITLTAMAGSVTETATVDVTGTSISISGESSLTTGDSTTLTITLVDSDGNPISGELLTVSSSLGSTLSSASLTTDSAGQVQVSVTPGSSGTDSITASALGASASHALTISGDEFQITAPLADTDINLNSCAELNLNWLVNSSPNTGQTISFSATRGTIYSDSACTNAATSAVTDANGDAKVYISSTFSGPSTLTAFASGGPSTSISVNFVATTAAMIDLQVDNATIGPNDGSQTVQQQATITATVRDPNNNLVKGKLVRFEITQDLSGGTLTTATATTDSLGRANTTYVSSAATTSKDGVEITAFVDDTPSVSGTVNLTVAQNGLFVRLGTGNNVAKVGATQYNKQYVVMVTDASGNAVANESVDISINPERYAKGYWVVDVDKWVRYDPNNGNQSTVTDTCPNEDVNENGILDPGEDINSNGTLEPGNIAAAPASVITGADGTFEFDILYAREYAEWVEVRLTASTQVAGTESSDTVVFWLPIAAEDTNDTETALPGVNSPFGTQGGFDGSGCYNTL